jgi:hypothetical protein
MASVTKFGRLVRHLLEMVLAMAVGMAIFVVSLHWLLTPTGYLALQTHDPFLWFAGMGVFMTVPMIALMRYYQAHSWRQCGEMTVAMLVPPGTIAALVQLGVVAYPWLAVSTLSHSTHVTMLLGMIVLMLYRRDQHVGVRSGAATPDVVRQVDGRRPHHFARRANDGHLRAAEKGSSRA